jgi:hypothetical protein
MDRHANPQECAHSGSRPGQIRRVLPDPHHEDGRHKARVFKALLGFDQTNHSSLIEAIRGGIMAHEAEYVGVTAHGVLWRVDMPITGPRGTATVRTGWIYEQGQDVPRLTTAYVLSHP